MRLAAKIGTGGPQDIQLWQDAIKAVKPSSARGIDAISPQELKLLPTQAIGYLMHVMNSYTQGFPLWSMWTKTCSIPKKTGYPRTRPHSAYQCDALLYRVWSRVQCKHVMFHIHSNLPPAITGFVPGRGPYDAVYDMQWKIELAHEQGTPQPGISIDLLRCFNTLHRPTAREAMTQLGIPQSILQHGSLQKVMRSWSLLDTFSLPIATRMP